MSGLPPELVKRLLAKPTRKKKEIDTSIRDYPTWFSLNPQIHGDVPGESDFTCDNPNCLDDRPPRKTSTGKEVKSQFVVVIDGQRVCRRCFMGGWLLENEAQESLNVD